MHISQSTVLRCVMINGLLSFLEPLSLQDHPSQQTTWLLLSRLKVAQLEEMTHLLRLWIKEGEVENTGQRIVFT